MDQFFWDFAANINEGGVFVESNNPLNVGETVQIKFFLPNLDSPIETRGEVVWVGIGESSEDGDEPSFGKPGMGIHFKDLDKKNKEAINQLVNKLKKESGT